MPKLKLKGQFHNIQYYVKKAKFLTIKLTDLLIIQSGKLCNEWYNLNAIKFAINVHGGT